MTDLSPFEQQLRERLGREVGHGAESYDAAAIARAAIGSRTLGDHLRNRFGGDASTAPRLSGRLGLVAIAVLLLVAALVGLAVGGWLTPRHDQLTPQLALVTRSGIELANADGSARTLIYSTGALGTSTSVIGSVSWMRWAPGGEHLAIQVIATGGYELRILDRAGHVTGTWSLQSRPAEVAWSPDGRQLAVLDGGFGPGSGSTVSDARLIVIGLDGQQAWTAALPEPFAYVVDQNGLTWSPGPDIAVVGVSGTRDGTPTQGTELTSTWLVDPVSRSGRRLTAAAVSLENAPAWSPNGHLLIAREGLTAPEIWEIDPSTGQERRLVALTWLGCGSSCLPGMPRELSPSPDGSTIVFLGPGGVGVVDPGANSARELVSGADLTFGPITWLNDGAHVLLMLNQAADSDLPDVVAVDVSRGDTAIVATGAAGYDLSRPARVTP